MSTTTETTKTNVTNKTPVVENKVISFTDVKREKFTNESKSRLY
jgi:hypothetical protein